MEQIEIIKKLINQSNITEIIHSCDADAEGEVIGRIVIQKTCKKPIPVSRLWLPDTTPETIRSAYYNRKSDFAYEKLFQQGQTRSFVDWIIGINLSRGMTIKTGELVSIGRVIIPIVQKIVERDIEIGKFESKPYWVLTNDNIESSQRFDNLEQAKQMCNKYNISKTIVQEIISKNITKKPPNLFSQTTLQNTASREYGMKPSEVLAITQSLYEKGLTSYPRTDSEYLSSNEVDKVKGILSGYDNTNCTGKEYVFNDNKVESHSAIIPLCQIENQTLSDDERKIFDLIEKGF